jgi:hypothetical protein
MNGMYAKSDDDGLLFSRQEMEQLIQEPNPMVRKFGRLVGGRTCRACRFLERKTYHDKPYYKCHWRGDTRGAGTDHRVRWTACKKFEEQSER